MNIPSQNDFYKQQATLREMREAEDGFAEHNLASAASHLSEQSGISFTVQMLRDLANEYESKLPSSKMKLYEGAK